MSYWQDRYNSQGYEHYGAIWHIGDGKYDNDLVERKEFFNEWTRGQEFGTCLDFGCGNAYMSELFEVYLGIDILDDLRKKNKKKYPDQFFITAEIPEQLIISIEKTDLALCISSLQYVNNQRLGKWLRYFKENCDNLIIQDSTTKSDDHTYYRSHKELKKICKKFGFKVHKEISTGARWLWLK